MVLQLRTYTIRSEFIDEWIEFFETVAVPLHAKYGIPVVAAWRQDGPADAIRVENQAVEGQERFVWLRSFSSKEAAEAEEAAYRQSPERVAAGFDIPTKAVVGAVISFVEPLSIG